MKKLVSRDIASSVIHMSFRCCYCDMKLAKYEVYYKGQHSDVAPNNCHAFWCYVCDDCGIKLGVTW